MLWGAAPSDRTVLLGLFPLVTYWPTSTHPFRLRSNVTPLFEERPSLTFSLMFPKLLVYSSILLLILLPHIYLLIWLLPPLGCELLENWASLLLIFYPQSLAQFLAW